MELGSKLLKNTSYLTIGSQIGNLLQFILFLYFARQFGEKIVGQYSFAFSFTFLFSVLADLGLSVFMIREVARDKSGTRQIFAECLSLRLISIVSFTLLASAIVLFFFSGFPEETTNIIVLLGLYHIFLSIADVFLSEFIGHNRMGLVTLLNIFVKFVISSAGICLIWMQLDFLTVLTCFPIGSFVYLLLSISLSFHYFRHNELQFKALDLRGLFLKAFPFTLALILVHILYQQDILILRFLKDDQAVGFYSVSNSIILALMGILFFVHTALLPTFSKLYIDSRPKLIEISRQSLRFLLLIGLPVSTGLYAISDKLIMLLFSHSFIYSVGALDILSWSIALGFAATTYSVLLTAINRQKEKVFVIGICVIFNFVLNLVLIPKLSYNGTAVAKLLTEFVHLILMAYMVSKYLTWMSLHSIFVKPILSCIIMYFFIQFVYHLNTIYLIPTSALVYFVSLGAMRGYDKEEIKFLKHVFFKTPRIANS
jgi:O-antigen/teichoic acid export membrane protein